MDAQTTLTVARMRKHARTGRGRHLRQKVLVTIPELASLIGVSPSTLSRWERGLVKPSQDGAVKWAAALIELGAKP